MKKLPALDLDIPRAALTGMTSKAHVQHTGKVSSFREFSIDKRESSDLERAFR
jgi:hypothetical protein